MKVQFLKEYTDPTDGRVFPRYAVAEVGPADGQRLISDGVAHKVPPETRLFVSETLITDCVPTGQSIGLDELTGTPTKKK